MKMVCMCQGGNSRSVACAYLLKYEYGHDALSLSWEKNEQATKNMLFDWADIIIVMQERFLYYVPSQYFDKTAVVDVGEDVWCNGLHPALLEKCRGILNGGLNVGMKREPKYSVPVNG